MKKTGILFVCTGNICRSPTAEAVFRHRVAQAGLAALFDIDSAGTENYHVGEQADHRTRAAAKARGIAMDDLRARVVEDADFERFDLILAMDRGHYRALQKRKPAGSKAEVALFLDYAEGEAGRDVPDPYYGGHADFTRVLDLVERGAEGLLSHLWSKKETR